MEKTIASWDYTAIDVFSWRTHNAQLGVKSHSSEKVNFVRRQVVVTYDANIGFDGGYTVRQHVCPGIYFFLLPLPGIVSSACVPRDQTGLVAATELARES